MCNLTEYVVDISLSERNTRPPRQASLCTEVIFGKHFGDITLPTIALALPKWLTYAIEAFTVMGLVPQLTVGVALGFGAQSDQ